MEDLREIVVAIGDPEDATVARQRIREMAVGLNFAEKETEELVLVTTELSTNLVKHAKGGTLAFKPLAPTKKAGIEITATDSGPGIANVDHAVTDGYSTVGSLGYGLGTVNRLMDEMSIVSTPGKGTVITCKKWARQISAETTLCPFDIGAATRPHVEFRDFNGDSFIIKKWGESVLIGVIDGLGHGVGAQRAALAARQYVENHFAQPLESIFQGTGWACRATHGVVMALARFLWREETVCFGSVGNVETRVFAAPEPMNFIVRRGEIGLNAPRPVVVERKWLPTFVMVMFSDGVKSHWRWEDFSKIHDKPASTIAKRLLDDLGRDNDDATVLVVKSARTSPEDSSASGIAHRDKGS